MYVVLAEFLVGAEHTVEFQARVVENAQKSKGHEPGCHQFDVAVAPGEPGRILLYELYDDRAAFDAHLKSPHFLAFDAVVKPWIVEKKVRTFQLVEPAGPQPET
ncbi:MAG: antibiotic biosynthesis monooxygenase [Deltaproteobacteria bacterium]|nr:antibiotic biosynthesis monooxygenase [Deltaproteobacteria bacterium]